MMDDTIDNDTIDNDVIANDATTTDVGAPMYSAGAAIPASRRRLQRDGAGSPWIGQGILLDNQRSQRDNRTVIGFALAVFLVIVCFVWWLSAGGTAKDGNAGTHEAAGSAERHSADRSGK